VTPARRSLDPNEERYLVLRWRELRRTARINAITFVVTAVVIGGILALALTDLLSRDKLVGALVMSALIGPIVFDLVVVASAHRQRARGGLPANPSVEVLDGPFRAQRSRGQTTHSLGGRALNLPAHWIPILGRADPSRSFRADAVEGPGGEMIVLKVGDRLAVSAEVAGGLMEIRQTLLPLFAIYSFIALAFATLLAVVNYDPQLSLFHYLAIGRRAARPMSVARFRSAPPPLYGQAILDGVVLGRGSRGNMVALDAPVAPVFDTATLTADTRSLISDIERFERDRLDPIACCNAGAVRADERGHELELTLGLLRRFAVESFRSDELTAILAGDFFDLTLGRRAQALFVRGQAWVARVERVSSVTGVTVAGTGVPTDVNDALARVAAYGDPPNPAPGGPPQARIEEVVLGHLRTYPAALEGPAAAMRTRHTLSGLVLSDLDGTPCLVVGRGYPRTPLIAQGVAAALALLTTVLIVLAVRELRRQRLVARDLTLRYGDAP
jgi:hypothetical protein